MCSKDIVSETHYNYQNPKLKKPAATRGKLFEQFLWQEMYDEYIRYNDSLQNLKPEKANSEYFHQYCKVMPPEDEVAKEELINRYPLYSTRAITLWNHNGDYNKDFKRRYTVTRPVHLQNDKFG